MLSAKQKVFRILMHIPSGIVTVLAFLLGLSIALCLGISPIAGAILGVGMGGACLIAFMIYEINEDRHLHDQAFVDILGYLIGLYGTIVVLFTISCIW
ncbi:hypothetical protein ES708_24479 [subsurface metagenome]